MLKKVLSSFIIIIYLFTLSSPFAVFAEEKKTTGSKAVQSETQKEKKESDASEKDKKKTDDSEKKKTDDSDAEIEEEEYRPHAKHLLAVDMKSGLFMYEKNITQSFNPGSLVKILTAITVLDNIKNIDKTVTIPDGILENYDYDNGNIGLRYGENMTVRSLLEAMLIYDAGDCALALAYTTADKYEKFIAMMNETAKKAGAENSVFTNPTGNEGKSQKTTLSDMYHITKYALKNKTFAKIVSTERVEFAPTNKYLQPRILFNTNQFITTYYSLNHKNRNMKGVKSYYNSDDDCGVIALYEDSVDSILLLCADSNRRDDNNYSYNDAEFILNYSKSNYKMTTLLHNEEIVSEIMLPNGKESDHLLAVSNGIVQAKLPITHKSSDIKIKTDLREQIMAPVKKGEILGSASVYYGDNKCGTVELVAYSDIGHSTINLAKHWMSIVFNSLYFKLILVALAALFLYKAIRVNSRKKQ